MGLKDSEFLDITNDMMLNLEALCFNKLDQLMERYNRIYLKFSKLDVLYEEVFL